MSMSLFFTHLVYYIDKNAMDLDCWFNIFILVFIRHVEAPAIFEDPNSLKQVNVSSCIVLQHLLGCRILFEQSLFIYLFWGRSLGSVS